MRSDTNTESKLTAKKEKAPEEIIDYLFSGGFDVLRNLLLTAPWHVGMIGGTNYSCRKITTTVNGNITEEKFLLPDDKALYNLDPATQKESIHTIKIPATVSKLLNSIEESQKDKSINKMNVMLNLVKTLTDRTSSFLKSDHHEEYLQILTALNGAAEVTIQNIIKTLENTIKVTQRTINNPNPPLGYKPDSDKIFIEELKQTQQKINEVLAKNKDTTPNALVSDKNIQALNNTINDVLLPLKKAVDEKNRRSEKFVNFFNKKLLPYKDFLEKNIKANNNPHPEVLDDLTLITKRMMTDHTSVHCSLNSLNELEVRIDGEVYNLTQILIHQPDFKYVNLDDSDLDAYYYYVAKEAVGIYPDGLPGKDESLNETDDYYRSKLPHECKTAIESSLPPDVFKRFEKCHVSSLIGFNIYTGEPYAAMNMLLNKKTLPADIFSNLPANKGVADALIRVGNKFGADPNAPLNDKQIDVVTKELLMAIVTAAVGIKNVDHFSYDPSMSIQIDQQSGDLALEGGRTVSGAAGDWAIIVAKEDEMYKKTGMGQYQAKFSSTTLNNEIAQDFIKGANNPNMRLLKVNILGTESAADVTPFSKYAKEKEIVCAPGSIILIVPASQIKRPEHYQGSSPNPVNEKISNVIVDNKTGGGPMVEYYSSAIQKIRCDLIALSNNEQLKSEIQNNPFTDVKKFEDSINAAIKETSSQLKNMEIYIALDKNDLPKLPDGVSAGYVLTQDQKIFFIDKDKDTTKELPVTNKGFYEITDSLMITQKLQALDTTSKKHELVIANPDLLRKTFLKISTQHDFKLDYTVEETLTKLENRIKKIEEDFNALSDYSSKTKLSSFMDGAEKIKGKIELKQQQILAQKAQAAQQPTVSNKI